MTARTGQHDYGAAGGDVFGRRDLGIVVAVLVLTTVVRLVFSFGIFSPDETNYLRNASDWMTGQFELADALFLHDTRPLMFVPVAWAFTILGVSEAAALAWPFLAALGVVFCVYLVALRLLGRETAVYAALCAAFFPLLVQESTRLLPGAVMNLLTALCALFFVISEQNVKRRGLWLAASGMAYAAIQLAGELGIVLGLLFFAAVLVWRRYSLLSYWPAVAGFAFVTALIFLSHWTETGTPFFKFELSKNILVQIKSVAPNQPLYYVKLMLLPLAGGGGVYYLAGIGFFAGIAQKRRAALFVALWVVLTWLLLEFGSVSLTEYRPLSKEIRYFSVVSVPSVIMAGYGISWIRGMVSRWMGARGRRLPVAAVTGILVLVAVTSALTLQKKKSTMSTQRSGLRDLRNHVVQYEGRPVYVTHWMWNTYVGYWLRFEDAYLPSGYDPYHAVHFETADSTSMNRYVQTLAPGEAMGPGLLVHDERLFEISQGERESWSIGLGEIPAVLADISADWRFIDRITVNERYVLALYDIPEGATWPGPAMQDKTRQMPTGTND